LIFLLNLSIRTRLDRLDGTGEMAWSDPVAVEATVAGMLAGLAEKPPPFELPLPFTQLFRRYLANCSAEDLLDLCNGIAATYPPEAPETLHKGAARGACRRAVRCLGPALTSLYAAIIPVPAAR
jgi:hypothetical protein